VETELKYLFHRSSKRSEYSHEKIKTCYPVTATRMVMGTYRIHEKSIFLKYTNLLGPINSVAT